MKVKKKMFGLKAPKSAEMGIKPVKVKKIAVVKPRKKKK